METDELVYDEWLEYFRDSVAIYRIGLMGHAILRDWLGQEMNNNSQSRSGSLWMAGPGASDDEPVYRTISNVKLLDSLEEDGSANQDAGRLWIVAVYTTWETEYRPRLIAQNHPKANISIMGDFRLLRNDIVHHRGLASEDNSGKCKVLLKYITVNYKVRVTSELVLTALSEFDLTIPLSQSPVKRRS